MELDLPPNVNPVKTNQKPIISFSNFAKPKNNNSSSFLSPTSFLSPLNVSTKTKKRGVKNEKDGNKQNVVKKRKTSSVSQQPVLNKTDVKEAENLLKDIISENDLKELLAKCHFENDYVNSIKNIKYISGYERLIIFDMEATFKENHTLFIKKHKEVVDKIEELKNVNIKIDEALKSIPDIFKNAQLRSYCRNVELYKEHNIAVIEKLQKRYDLVAFEELYNKLANAKFSALRQEYSYIYGNILRNKLFEKKPKNAPKNKYKLDTTLNKKGRKKDLINYSSKEGRQLLKIQPKSLSTTNVFMTEEVVERKNSSTSSEDSTEEPEFNSNLVSSELAKKKQMHEKLDQFKVAILAYQYDQNFQGLINSNIQENKYCVKCDKNGQKIKMEYILNPPAYCCGICGFQIEHIDIRSQTVIDKHNLNTTVVKTGNTSHSNHNNYCTQIINSVQGGSTKLSITKRQWDKMYYQIAKRKVTKLSQVNETMMRNIIEHIYKVEKDESFAKLDKQVGAITNMIRGKQILKLSDEDLSELKMVMNKIENDISAYVADVAKGIVEDSDEDESLTIHMIIQLAFWALQYPEEIVLLFKPVGGIKNVNKYQRICDYIVKKNDWDSTNGKFNLVRYNNLQFGDFQDINSLLENNDKDEFISDTTTKSRNNSQKKDSSTTQKTNNLFSFFDVVEMDD